MPTMRIIYQDEILFAIDKPAGHFVHPPERSAYPVPREKVCLHTLREQLGRAVYPVHRLDAPTSGLVLFAYTKDATRELSRLFHDREIEKTYLAVVRGHLDDEGSIQLPLEIKNFKAAMAPNTISATPNESPATPNEEPAAPTEEPIMSTSRGPHFAVPSEAETHYRTLARIELPFAVGNKYPTARYSLLEVKPTTGRWHQIRRHFDRIAHPLLGDIEHGDSHHNRFFRDELKIQGLCLRAVRLEFTHPADEKRVVIEAPPCEKWEKIRALFDQNPFA